MPRTAYSTDVSAAQPAGQEYLRLRGVRVHNLRNVDVDIPHNQLVVITGPSGSGKSSLAFDTIYAEGQRQYIESLSTYARQFLDQLERPDVDLVEGLEPTIAIDQHAGAHNPRSTVGTVTEIYDHLRLLMARLGTPRCPGCGAAISQQFPEQILEELLRLGEGTKAMLLAPLVRGRRGQHQEVLDEIRKAGFVRARVDGQVYDIEQVPPLAKQKNHTIEAVVDRVVIREDARGRVAESLDLALKHGQGLLVCCFQNRQGQWEDRLFNTRFACPECGSGFQELEPRTFSFNSPYGACPACQGLGTLEQFDPQAVLPEASRSLVSGAVAPWRRQGRLPKLERSHRDAAIAFIEAAGASADTPIDQLPRKLREQLIEGDGRGFPGLLAMLEEEYQAAADDDETINRLAAYRRHLVCSECEGSRLRPEARAVTFAGKAIHEITAMPISEAVKFFAQALQNWTGRQASASDGSTEAELATGGAAPAAPAGALAEEIARRILPEILGRLQFLEQVGLGYLSLDRGMQTLSGGESQRVRLATGIGSGLVGVCYVLDEPSLGLHPTDTARLLSALRKLQQLGNTLLVVEHDEAIMRAADHLIDLGPGAGRNGGHIVARGTPDEVARVPESLTGQYLSGRLAIEVPTTRRQPQSDRWLRLTGARGHNLKNVTLELPLGLLVCVTGVSGSGKSTLLNDTLAPAVAAALGLATGDGPAPFDRLEGVEQIDKLIRIDQSPIGRTPRSNPATYTGAFDEIRQVFAETKEARIRGFKPSRFSFNVPGGRCEDCGGHGVKRLEMNFLPDLYVRCETCQGRRFNRQTLEVQYRGHTIADVLELTVDEAVDLFAHHGPIHRPLVSLQEVGLGYVALGQASSTLSGGEAQRVKLAAELARIATGNTLYLLDEPTSGLHLDDVRRLILVLERLVERGNTVVVIEHHLDVIKRADWVVDLGPDGGEAGGRIVAAGPPEQIAATAGSRTGEALRPMLARK